MRIKNRLYSYPVLSEDNDDYINSKFDVVMENTNKSINKFTLSFKIKMDNDEINELIKAGKAEYVIHVECSSTAYRFTRSSGFKNIEFEIQTSRVRGKIEVVAFIIAKEDLINISNKDWNEDYEGVTFCIKKGSILGYKNLDIIDVKKDYNEFSGVKSIFKLYRNGIDEPRPMVVNLDGDYIMVGLGMKEYDIYSKLSNIESYQTMLNSMIILPALIYIFNELKSDIGIDTYYDKEWFESLLKSYKKRGIDLIDELTNENKTSLEMAQEALELPITKAFDKLKETFEGNDEEE